MDTIDTPPTEATPSTAAAISQDKKPLDAASISAVLHTTTSSSAKRSLTFDNDGKIHPALACPWILKCICLIIAIARHNDDPADAATDDSGVSASTHLHRKRHVIYILHNAYPPVLRCQVYCSVYQLSS